MHSACRAFNIVMQSGWAVLGVSRRHRLALTVWLEVAAWLRKNRSGRSGPHTSAHLVRGLFADAVCENHPRAQGAGLRLSSWNTRVQI